MESQQIKRRPIRARETKWAAATTRWLARAGLKPNQISILSVVCAGFAGGCLLLEFCGPMAKQQRMAVIIAACLLSIVEVILDWPSRVMMFALGIVMIGCVITTARRTLRIIKELESR